MALPALAVVLALAMWAVGAVNAQLRCVDAARLAARAVARGEDQSVSIGRAQQAAPPGARVSVARAGDLVTVVVRAPRPMVGAWAGGPGVVVEGRATADAEEAVLEAAVLDAGPGP